MNFKVYLLDAGEHIIARFDIEAPNADQAALVGFERAQQEKLHREIVGIEIWSGARHYLTAIPGKSQRTSDGYAMRAEEARVLAEQMHDLAAQSAMLMIADGYQRLADRASELEERASSAAPAARSGFQGTRTGC